MTNPFSVIAFVAAATGVALLGAIGRRPAAYNYVGQHHTHKPRRMSVQQLKASMSWRVRSAGVEQPVEPMPEESTVSLSGNAVVALGQLAARRDAKSTPAVIELSADEVLDVLDEFSNYHAGAVESLGETEVPETDDDCGCSTYMPDGYRFDVECEAEGDHDTCSAFGGEFTWPRKAVLEVAA